MQYTSAWSSPSSRGLWDQQAKLLLSQCGESGSAAGSAVRQLPKAISFFFSMAATLRVQSAR